MPTSRTTVNPTSISLTTTPSLLTASVTVGIQPFVLSNAGPVAIRVLEATGGSVPTDDEWKAAQILQLSEANTVVFIQAGKQLWGRSVSGSSQVTIQTYDMPVTSTFPPLNSALGTRLMSKLVARWNANFCYQEHNVTTAGTPAFRDGDVVGTMVDLDGPWDAKAAASDTTRGRLNTKILTTTVTAAAANATQSVLSTAGMVVGDSLYFGNANNAYRIIQSITNATTVVLTATITTALGDTITRDNTVNGLPAVTFPTAAVLKTATGFWTALATTGFTILVFTNPGKGTTSSFRLAVGSDNAAGPYFGVRSRSGGYDLTAVNLNSATNCTIATVDVGNLGSTPLAGNASAVQDSCVIYTTVSTGNITTAGMNGVELATGTCSAIASMTGRLEIGNHDGGGGNFFCECPIHEICVYSGVLTASEIQSETSRMLSLGTQPSPLVIVDSNSYGLGWYDSAQNSLASMPTHLKSQLKSLTGTDINTVQLSVAGLTTTNKINSNGGAVSVSALKRLGYFSSSRKVAHLLIEARNDMAQDKTNATGAAAWANTVTMGQLAQSFGIRDVFIWTVPVSSDQTTYDAQFEARRLVYNALARANAAQYEFILVDICALMPELNLTASLTDATIYFTDLLHFQPATYAKINYYLAKAIAARWASQTSLIS